MSQTPDPSKTSFDIGALLTQGYLSPRRSMANILAMQLDEHARLLMVMTGVVISLLGLAMFVGHPETATGPGIIAGYGLSVLLGLAQYRLVAIITGFICGFLGGNGSANDNLSMAAWWALVTAPLTVLMALSVKNGETQFAALTLIFATVLSMVLLAAYIAETHAFRSTASVCGGMFAILMLIGFVISSFLPVAG